MFGIGGFELFIILIFAFLIFGPEKLPEIGRVVGQGIARFREAQQEMNEVIGDEKLVDLDNLDEPFKNPIDALDRIAQRQEEKRAVESEAKTSSAETGANVSSSAAEQGQADTSVATQDDAAPKQESFTERKARYERERAARKAAEAAAENAAPSGGTREGGEGDAASSPDVPASNAEAVAAASENAAEETAEGGEA